MGNIIVDIKARIKRIILYLEKNYIREASAEFENLEREINSFLNIARSGEARKQMLELKRFAELAAENINTSEFDVHKAFTYLAQVQKLIRKFWGV